MQFCSNEAYLPLKYTTIFYASIYSLHFFFDLNWFDIFEKLFVKQINKSGDNYVIHVHGINDIYIYIYPDYLCF